MNKCEFCKKEATHVIVSHPTTRHSQWQNMAEMPLCNTCHQVAKYMVHLTTHENDFIMLKEIENEAE